MNDWVFMDISTEMYPNTFTKIDKVDFDRVSNYKWHKNSSGYAGRCTTLYGRGGLKICYLLHRDILNPQPKQWIDHINGDRLDNRRSNIRICTPSQNNMNIGPINGRKYKGVFKTKHGVTYEAKIGFNNKTIYLGCFDSQQKAARAYNVAAKLYFGEFARLNNVVDI